MSYSVSDVNWDLHLDYVSFFFYLNCNFIVNYDQITLIVVVNIFNI